MAKLYEKESMKPVIDNIYSFEESIEAIDYLSKGHAKGKVVLEFSGWIKLYNLYTSRTTFAGFFAFGMIVRFRHGLLYNWYDWLVRFSSNTFRVLF